MQDKKTNVIKDPPTEVFVVSYSDTQKKPKRMKVGIWSPEEKQDFLAQISAHKPSDFDMGCSFNVHHDKILTHVSARGATKQFTPMHYQYNPNELVIEIIPDLEPKECKAKDRESCLECLKTGGCQSYPIKTLIGMILFKEQYTK